LKNYRFLAVLAVASVLLGVIAWVSHVFRLPPAVPAGDETLTVSPVPAAESGPGSKRPATEADPPQPPVAPVAAAPDSDSIEGILAALASPDKETRVSAIERSKQLEDRSVVPRLQEAVERLDDVREKADLLAAIDFLNLPSLTEFQAARKSNLVSRSRSAPTRVLTNR
jgi:hypothetical protein